MKNVECSSLGLYKISKFSEFQNDKLLYIHIFNILKESYEDPTLLIERAYKNNNTIYLCHDNANNLLGFFMVGMNYIDGKEIIYLGLSGVLSEKKGLGIGKNLYKTHFDDLKKETQESGKDIICWATTASISVFYALKSVYGNIAPDENLNFDQESLELAEQICKFKNIGINKEFPFLVKGIALSTNYSIIEKDRLKKFTTKNTSNFFETITLQEHLGDRLILILKVN